MIPFIMKRIKLFGFSIFVFLIGLSGCNAPQLGKSFFVARFKMDGRLDKSFQNEGVAFAAFDEGSAFSNIGTAPANGSAAMAHAVMIDKNMRVVAAGCANVKGRNQIALARFEEKNGALDGNFGVGGRSLSGDDLGEFCEARALAIDFQNRILTAGFVQKNEGPDYSDLAIVCYTEDGKIDSSFGYEGTIITNFWKVRDEFAYAIGLSADQKVVVAGVGYEDEDMAQLVAARYTRDGDLDRSYGHSGRVVTEFTRDLSPELYDMAIDRSGRIIAAGRAFLNGKGQFAMIRYDAEGQRDRTFGANGVATIKMSGAGTERAAAVAVYPDGRIVVAGESDADAGGGGLVLVRFLSNGQPDRSFGGKGYVRVDIPPSRSETVSDVALDLTGRVVVIGRATMKDGQNKILLMRHNFDGKPDESLGGRGFVLTGIPGASDQEARSLSVDPFGNIIVAGWADFNVREGEDTPENNRPPITKPTTPVIEEEPPAQDESESESTDNDSNQGN